MSLRTRSPARRFHRPRFPPTPILFLLAICAGPSGFSPHAFAACPDDVDCDGVPDSTDNCPFDPNPDQRDNDQDGAGDVCDFDDDNDGIADVNDNCDFVPNPGQEDEDGDSVGDACDPCPGDSINDPDGDFLCGNVDNCPNTRNPDQADTDGDGEGDACDLDDGLIGIGLLDPIRVWWQRDPWYLDSFQLYRGDLDVLRSTGVYIQDPALVPLASRRCEVLSDRAVEPTIPPLDRGVFYLVAGSYGGIERSLGQDWQGADRPNPDPCIVCDRPHQALIIDSQSGVSQEQYRVIDNEQDWCALLPAYCGWSAMNFSTHVALVAALGGRSTPCYNVRIVCVDDAETPHDIHFPVLTTTPAGCTCTTVISSPIYVARLPRPVGSATHTVTSQPLCP